VTVTDWIQAVSAVLVLVALILSILQLRAATEQTLALRQSIEEAAQTSLVGNQSDLRTLYLRDDPALLAWYLSTRGYKCTSPEENKRRIFALVKLESHEASYLRHSKGLLDEEIWTAWKRVIELDFRMPEFREAWADARGLFVNSFMEFIDMIIAEADQDVNKAAESFPEIANDA